MSSPLQPTATLFLKAGRALQSGQTARARTLYLNCIRLYRQTERDESLKLARVYGALAYLEDSGGDFHAALDFAIQAGAQADKAVVEPENQDGLNICLTVWGLLGNLQRLMALYPEAEATLRKALNFAILHFGETSPETDSARSDLSILYKYTDKFDEAEKLLRTALADVLARQTEPDDLTATLYHNLGGLAHARGDFAGGVEDARKAWDIHRALFGEDASESLADAGAYAGILDGLERYEESEPIYRRILAVFEELYGPEHYEIAVNLNNLAAVRHARGDEQEAEQLYRRTLAIKQKTLGAQHPDTALTANNLGVLLLQSGRFDEARECFSSALDVFEKVYGPGHHQTIMVAGNLSLV